MTKKTKLMTLVRKLDRTAKEAAFAGQTDPESAAQLRANYHKAKRELYTRVRQMEDGVPAADAMKCDCQTWADSDLRLQMLGNGHHRNCKEYKPDPAVHDLLLALVRGIKWWASQEDGVPEELWDAYAKAHLIAHGALPKEKVNT